MRAGRLNQSITIQRYTKTRDSYGQETRSWADLLTVRAEVKTDLETENNSGGKVDGQTRYKVMIRYTDITKKDRIIWSGKTLQIKQVVDPSNKRDTLILQCDTND